MNLYSNKHLIEVNCGFAFPNETTLWDSTFFGQYYEKIKVLGFSDREERKGVQIKFEAIVKSAKTSPISASEIEDQIVFRNPQKGWAILMGKGKISFHILKDYTKWDDFIEQFIKPFTELYKGIGLGNGTRQCSVVYLNRFAKKKEENLSDYFTMATQLDSKFGVETVTSVQRVFNNTKNLLIAKLNSQTGNDDINTINLECGAICVNTDCLESDDWLNQAYKTREPIREFFEELITERLRKEL